MSDIPLARTILRAALQDMPEPWAGSVRDALSMMRRRPPAKPRAPARKRKMDKALAAAVRMHVQAHPQCNLQDLAQDIGTGCGRVSEAIHGLR